ncbi:MAG TPA: PKD domain-containing protein, partial [Candidatus Methanoperedens sp.]|nr:PKD domain-containing protein [Candidatus Methanoperedens sp.]
VQTYSTLFGFENPPYPAATTYQITARVAAGGDALPANDLRAENLTISPSKPDFEVVSERIFFSFDPSRHPSRNEKFTITADVCNVGQMTGASFQVAFYEEGQEQIGVVQTITPSGGLLPGQCYTATPLDAVGTPVPWGTGFSRNHVILVSVAPIAGSQDDPNDGNNQATRKVWVNVPPTAQAAVTGRSTVSHAGDTVTFSGAGSDDDQDLDGLGGVASYRWDFGDQTAPVTTATPVIEHTYAAPGDYQASLTVEDNNGEWSESAASASATVQWYTVMAIAGADGTIDPAGEVSVEDGAAAVFTVTPNANYHIAAVTGCGGTLAGSIYTTGPVTADCTVTASFAIDTHSVTPVAGANGSIAPNTPQTVDHGLTKSFTVTANANYHIAAVSGCDGTLAGSTYTTGPVTADCTVTASFAIDRHNLAVTKSGTGSGTVTSTPAGISCGGTCAADFDSGTIVNLAQAAASGSVFTGWSGACTGTGACTIAMSGSQAVTAAFAQAIVVTVPNGGESWRRGSTYTITWTYAGNPGAAVKIELLKAGALNRTISSSTSIGSSGSGSFSWKVPTNQTLGSDFKIRVTSTTQSAYTDSSNANFTIVK